MPRLQLILAIAAAATLAPAQSFTPFSAKVRTVVYDVAANGAKTVIQIEAGVYDRSSNGTTILRKHLVRNGKQGPDSAILTDPAGNVTRISWSRKAAMLVQDGPGAAYRAKPFFESHGAPG